MKRTAFFISDGTGITAETLGNSLLAQFESIEFERITLPYVDSVEKAEKAVEKINRVAAETGQAAIIFDTIVDKNIRKVIDASNALNIDIFAAFLAPLESELQVESSYTVGKSHSPTTSPNYLARIDAVNFALDNVDGARTRHYNDADIILIGVSRCGKTPTSLYMAMQYDLNSRIKLRMGYEPRKSSIPDDRRSVQAPLGDANLYSVGMGYQWDKDTVVDLSLSFMQSEEVILADPQGADATGEYPNSSDSINRNCLTCTVTNPYPGLNVETKLTIGAAGISFRTKF